MATITSEIPSKTASARASRRSRQSRKPEPAPATAPRRPARRAKAGGDSVLASLTEMVDQLIDENRQLKRALARAEKAQNGAGLGQAARALTGIQRRLNRALDGASGARRTRSAAAPASKPRRKVTDPEVLERRRQALAKARAARQAKRQAARA